MISTAFIIIIGAIIYFAISFRRTQELSNRVDYWQREIDILGGKISGLQTPKEAGAEERKVPSVSPNSANARTGKTACNSAAISNRCSSSNSRTCNNSNQSITATAFNRDVSTIDRERFMGVNLFAWIGGFVLFLATAFFVKYSIDNNLIHRNSSRGWIFAWNLFIDRRIAAFPETISSNSSDLCSTRILILYADVFASYSFYHFIEVTPAFLLIIAVTAVAFLLAVRLDAKLVAILGLLGGFFTPPLLSTGHDNPLGLFSYIFILVAGLIAIALRKKWTFLISLAA